MSKTGPPKGVRYKPQEHGTDREYKYYACRCDRCKQWQLDASRKYGQSPNHQASAKLTIRKKREFIRSAKNVPCMDCGHKFPYFVMEFDHTHGEKKFNLTDGPTQASMEQIKRELDKCEPVCANCHAIRTQSRKQPEVYFVPVTIQNYNLQFGRWHQDLALAA